MRRKTKRLVLEFGAACIVLAALTVFMVPKFFAAQNINTPTRIPDPVFRAFLEDYFKVGLKGVITVQQARSVKVLDFKASENIGRILRQMQLQQGQMNSAASNPTVNPLQLIQNNRIGDTTGLELFSNLEELHCYMQLTGRLDCSKNPKLRVIECGECQLQSLDIGNNPNLVHLSCGGNRLTQLDVSKNPRLKFLNCSKNKLTSLDVSANPVLERLDCSNNQLSAIDVSKNLNISLLDLSYNNLKIMPDLQEHIRLEALSVEFNFLTPDALPRMAEIKDRFTGEWSILRDKVYKGFLYEEQTNCNLGDFEKK